MKLNIDIKTIIIIVLAVILLLKVNGCDRIANLIAPAETVKETVTETINDVVNETTEEVNDLKPSSYKPIKQRVKVKNDKIKKVDSSYTPTPTETASGTKAIDLNKYNNITILPNGVLHSEILTSGTLYGTNFKLTTSDTTRTITKHTERVIAQSGFFVAGGSTIGIDASIQNIQAGIMYIHKNRWGVGAMLAYDTHPFTRQRLGVTVMAVFRL